MNGIITGGGAVGRALVRDAPASGRRGRRPGVPNGDAVPGVVDDIGPIGDAGYGLEGTFEGTKRHDVPGQVDDIASRRDPLSVDESRTSPPTSPGGQGVRVGRVPGAAAHSLPGDTSSSRATASKAASR
jgi:hypothetical protein